MRINYSVDDIRGLCAVARSGQFTRAAELLNITASALSRRIANIEAAVGGRVFDRSTRRVALTPLGAALYERLSPLLMQLDSSFVDASRVARGEEGTLVVGMVATVAFSCLPATLEKFQRRHRGVYVKVRDGIATSITQSVDDRQAEFGIATQMAFGASIVAERVGSYGFNLIGTAPVQRGQSRRGVRWDTLSGLRVVGLNAMSSTRLQLDPELGSLGISLPWTLEVDQLSTILSLVRSGRFVAVLPTLFDAKAHGLSAQPLVAPEVRRELFLVQRRGSALTPQGRTFRDVLVEEIARMDHSPS